MWQFNNVYTFMLWGNCTAAKSNALKVIPAAKQAAPLGSVLSPPWWCMHQHPSCNSAYMHCTVKLSFSAFAYSAVGCCRKPTLARCAGLSMQECIPLAVVMIRVQGPGLCDLVYAATHDQYHGCKAMTLLMQFLQLQLQKVHPYTLLHI